MRSSRTEDFTPIHHSPFELRNPFVPSRLGGESSLPRWPELLLLVLVAAAAFFASFKSVQDPDTFWHLAIGREIWQTHHLVRTETFSFTAKGAPWTDEEWLFHLLCYPLWLLGGASLAKWLTAACAALGVLGAYRCVRRAEGNALGLAIFVLPLLAVYGERFRYRPEIVSLVLMVALLEILLRSEASPPGLRRALPWLLALFLLWVQFHGAWAYGLVLTGAFLAGGLMDRWREGALALKEALQSAGIVLACWAVTLINPFGWRLTFFPVKHALDLLNHRAYVPIAEWVRTPLTGLYGLFAAMAAATLLAQLLLRPRRWSSILVVASQVALGLYWVRYAAYAVITLAPFAARSLQPLFNRRKIQIGAYALALPLAAWVAGWQALHPPLYPPMAERYPVQEAAFLKRVGFSGNLYHEFRVGGYLEWALDHRAKVFFDGRFGPFNEAGVAYYRAHRSIPAFEAFLARYPFDAALYSYKDFTFKGPPGTPPRGPSAVLFPPESWVMVDFGPYGMVLAKREPANQVLIQKYGYPLLRLDDLPYLLWSAERGTIPAKALIAELERALRASPPPMIHKVLEASLAQLHAPPKAAQPPAAP